MPTMSTSKVYTKTDRALEDKMLAVADDPIRVDALAKARAFKRTWIELAESLTSIHERELWSAWAFRSFEHYCKSELLLKPGTVVKLLGSFRFLETAAPKIIERARKEPTAPIPTVEAVDFVARATERGAADAATLREMRRAAFDEGAEAPLLSRRFKEVAFPVSDDDRADKVRAQMTSAARRLASLIADPDAPIPRKLAVRVEETLGELLGVLDKGN